MPVTPAQIAQARSKGLSDDEVLSYLTSQGLIDQTKAHTALSQGISPKEVLDYLATPTSGPGRYPAGGYGPTHSMPRPEGSLANPVSALEQGVYDASHGSPWQGAGELALGAGEGYGLVSGISEIPAGITAAIDAVASGTVGQLLKSALVRAGIATGAGLGAAETAKHFGASPTIQGLAGLTGGVVGGWLGKIPGFALQSPASLIKWAATQGNDTPLAKALIEEARGVTGGTPIEVSPSSRTVSPVSPGEPGPGFSGTQLPAPTGRGGPTGPLPVLQTTPRGGPPSYGGGNPADYVYSGGDQYQIPGVNKIIQPTGVTGGRPVTTSPASGATPASPALGPKDQVALEIGRPIVAAQDAKAQKMAQYFQSKGIDPSTLDASALGPHETAAGFRPSRNPQASLARTQAEFGKLTPTTTSGNTTPSPSLEDTLKKSIAKVKTTKATPGPIAPVPTQDSSIYTFGNSPTWEFKRLGTGSWAQRNYNTQDPFLPVGQAQALDLEDSLTNKELTKKATVSAANK